MYRTAPQPAQPAARRNPLATAPTNNNNAVPPATYDQPPKPPAKTPASPPLPRQNSKTTPPSPPKIISDKEGRRCFHRVGFLGEGGFARVYEVKDAKGQRVACKVVTKTSLKTKKAKTKLYAEIKIHRSLEHPNIVNFQDCFEDSDNVYMTLELCPSGSLMDMLRRRRRFSEPESRFFMVQLIGACHYMHTHQVIHRDLKLGNLFLDANMNVKVGDFGLAALIENPGERKKTICGTPNYIAPEVLFDTANGHSFEVDTWSVGVILYTLVVGRPPFQTKDVKAIYKRIRDNEYEFPADRPISSAVRTLIQHILTPTPSERPSLYEIVDHDWFIMGPVPSYIPTSAHDAAPDFRHITKSVSDNNLARLRRYALLDEESPANQTLAASVNASANNFPTSRSAPNVVTSALSAAQQEKEFQKAVQPGSPISALLSSARQPLVMGNPTTSVKESPLMRKLQSVKESPLGRRAVTRGLDGIIEETTATRRRANHDDGEEDEARARKKELEAQKARIVAQMAPVREEGEEDVHMRREEDEEEDEDAEREMRRLEKERAQRRQQQKQTATAAPSKPAHAGRENIAPAEPGVAPILKRKPSVAVDKENARMPPPSVLANAQKVSGFDAAAQTLTMAFEARAAGKVFRDPRGTNLPLPDEKVFIVSWVDYCNKYGMGYALTDGSVGVHFNDSTTLVLSPDKVHFDYIAARRSGTIYVRKSYNVNEYPDEVKSKVYLLKHFERYIMDRLYGEYEYTFEDTSREKGMEWVQKYLRMKHVIVFKLSHDVLQFNFYDHSKLILSSQGLLVTHIDKHYKMTRWPLADIMATSLEPSSSLDPEAAKFNQRLVDKLKYCKEVLISIRTASSSTSPRDVANAEGMEGASPPRGAPTSSGMGLGAAVVGSSSGGGAAAQTNEYRMKALASRVPLR